MSLCDLAKPVIAQIHGYAMAGGLELASACDLAYAASDAAPRTPCCASRGSRTSRGPLFLAPRHAVELHLTGRVYTGEEAARIGLINRARGPQRDPHRRRPPGRAASSGRARERRRAHGADQGRAADGSGAELTAQIKAAQQKG
jgi:enoyl-CoA hydratase/carnithine racemase